MLQCCCEVATARPSRPGMCRRAMRVLEGLLQPGYAVERHRPAQARVQAAKGCADPLGHARRSAVRGQQHQEAAAALQQRRHIGVAALQGKPCVAAVSQSCLAGVCSSGQ